MPPTISEPIANGRPGRNRRVRADLAKEYVAGGERLLHAPGMMQALPRAIDDVTRDFGDDLYLRMMYDSQVAAAIHVLKTGILAQKATVTPARKEGEEGYEQAVEIGEFCERNLMRLANLRTHTLYNLLDALPLGHRIAEIVFQIAETGQDSGKVVLSALKVKPRKNLAIVVDAFMNIVGLLAAQPGKAPQPSTNLFVPGQENLSNLFPRRKFAIMTFRPTDEDPRGSSILRPAYNAWNLKMQLWPEALKHWSQFGGASIWGSTPENAQPVAVVDENGDPVLDGEGNPTTIAPTTDLLNILIQWRNGAAVAVPFGAELHPVPPQGEGEVWERAIRLLNREITIAVLLQELATSEGQRQSRAASETHRETLALLIGFGRTLAEELIEHDLFTPLIEMNYGPEAVALLPDVSLGDILEKDFEKMWNAAAFLVQSGYLAPSQLQPLDEIIGLPPRTPEEVEEWVLTNQPGPDDVAQAEVVRQRGREGAARKRGGGGKQDGDDT